jgi:hypothetical protein
MAKVITKHKLADGFAAADKRITRAIKEGILAEAQKIADDIRDSIHDPPGAGNVYKIYKYGLSGQEHKASASGQPPVNLTHVLQNSIGAALSADPMVRSISVKIGVVHEYDTINVNGDYHDASIPRALELGSPRMAPRPFIHLLYHTHAQHQSLH